MANLRVRGLVVVLGAWVGSGACGSADEALYVTMQDRKLTADGWQDGGGGCMFVSFDEEDGPSGGSAEGTAGVGASIDGGVPPSPLAVARSITSRGLRVVVTSDLQLLAIKLLTKQFLESGEIDRFEVTTRDGVRHEFAHRGAHTCESDVDLFTE